MSGASPIGARVPMLDSCDKVTGKGKYTDDLRLPGMLVGKILHSPHAHARIRAIDTSAARRLLLSQPMARSCTRTTTSGRRASIRIA